MNSITPIPQVQYQDLGRIRYAVAWDLQYQLQRKLIEQKLQIRNAPAAPEGVMPTTVNQTFEAALKTSQIHQLLFCEHNPVYTLGKNGSANHLLLNEPELEARGVEFFKINRGGDITYHGDGQITGYPIFDMECFFTDVHRYVRSIEEVIIRTLADYGLSGFRIKEYTGVWVEGMSLSKQTLAAMAPANDANFWTKKRKICAIGVHFSRWVTMHGFAFNVNTDLDFYKNIIPCGIDDADKTVTSLSVELGKEIDLDTVKTKLKQHFATVFDFEYLT
jgi:lipoyl(octanoyl) transferase